MEGLSMEVGLMDTVVSTLLTWSEDLILKVLGTGCKCGSNLPYSGHLRVTIHQSLGSRRYEPAKLWSYIRIKFIGEII